MALAVKPYNRNTPTVRNNIYQDPVNNIFPSLDKVDLRLNANEDAVKQSIINILLTNTGERPFQPNFGGDINRLLFENISPQTTTAIQSLIRSAIDNFEPRASIIDVVATPSPDENAYNISIIFSIINKTEPELLEFLLYRVR